MANHDPNHSSKQKTILWIISPVAVGLTLMFNYWNHKAPALREELDGHLNVKKAVVEKKAATPAVADTITLNTATVPTVSSH